MSPLMILALVAVAIVIFVVTIYNKLVKMRNHADEAWSDIDVQLKRRYNLIPNIVETVKGYAAHEEGVFTKVTEARSNAINAGNMQEQAQAENMLSGALKSLFAVAENYPDLKANENFMQLQNELVDTEDKIQAARRFYNGTVRDFNTKIQQFPNSIVASVFKFEAKEFFEVEDEEQKEPVQVSFDKGEKTEEAPVEETPPTEEEKPAEPAPEAQPEEKKEEELAAEEKPEEEIKEEEAKPAEEEQKEEEAAPEEEKPAEPEAPAAEEKPAEEEKKDEEPPSLPIEEAPEEKAAEEEKKEEEAAPAEEEKKAE